MGREIRIGLVLTAAACLVAVLLSAATFRISPSRLGALLDMKTSDIEKIVYFQDYVVTDPGEHFSILFFAGAGLEYQLENRHYSVGLAADGFLAPQFAQMRGLDGRAFLRYTY